jgi:hypothetical protein
MAGILELVRKAQAAAEVTRVAADEMLRAPAEINMLVKFTGVRRLFETAAEQYIIAGRWRDAGKALETTSVLLSMDAGVHHWADYFRHAQFVERTRSAARLLSFLREAVESPAVSGSGPGLAHLRRYLHQVGRARDPADVPPDYGNLVDPPGRGAGLDAGRGRRLVPPGWIPAMAPDADQPAGIANPPGPPYAEPGLPRATKRRRRCVDSADDVSVLIPDGRFCALGSAPERALSRGLCEARELLRGGTHVAALDAVNGIPLRCQEADAATCVRICVLYQMRRGADLFVLAHLLFRDRRPHDALPWLASGLCHLVHKRTDECRRHLM